MILALAVLGACTTAKLGESKPPGTGITGNRSTGGDSGQAGATGATGAGAGGSTTAAAEDGGGGTTLCEGLAAQYEVAIATAQQCSVGSAAQCGQLVSAQLSPCNSCLTYVNDAALPLELQSQWDLNGCGPSTAGQTCGHILCPTPTNNACLELGNGTGKCSFGTSAAGGDGGTGATDGGSSECGTLEQLYQTALAAAETCTVGASGQCSQGAPSDLSPCYRNCVAYVNDATELNTILDEWDRLGCQNTSVLCDMIACPGFMLGASACSGVAGSTTGSCEQVALATAAGG